MIGKMVGRMVGRMVDKMVGKMVINTMVGKMAGILGSSMVCSCSKVEGSRRRRSRILVERKICIHICVHKIQIQSKELQYLVQVQRMAFQSYFLAFNLPRQ